MLRGVGTSAAQRKPSDMRGLRSYLQMFVLALFAAVAAAAPSLIARGCKPTPAAGTSPYRAGATTGRVLIISVDGLRLDLLLRADAPHVRSLMARGSYTFWARTVPEAYTLPAHVSMV